MSSLISKHAKKELPGVATNFTSALREDANKVIPRIVGALAEKYGKKHGFNVKKALAILEIDIKKMGVTTHSNEMAAIKSEERQPTQFVANDMNSNTAPTIDDEPSNKEASIESQREILFNKILNLAKMKITCEMLTALRTHKGNTQASERSSIDLIKNILDEHGLSYVEASSQQSKDFRNVGGIGLDIEVKKTDGNTLTFNDTCPNSNIWYLVMFTGKKTKRTIIPPGVIGINGGEFIKDSEWVHEYQQQIDAIKDKYCRGEGARALSGPMMVYVRPTYRANINKFLERLIE